MCVLAVVVILASSAGAAETPVRRVPLSGLTGVYLVFANPSPGAQREGPADQTLRAEAESKLQGAGIRLLSEAQWSSTSGSPALHVVVSVTKIPLGIYAFVVNVELQQEIAPRTLAVTWRTHRVGVLRAARLPDVRGIVRDRIDQFVTDFLAANPQR